MTEADRQACINVTRSPDDPDTFGYQALASPNQGAAGTYSKTMCMPIRQGAHAGLYILCMCAPSLNSACTHEGVYVHTVTQT